MNALMKASTEFVQNNVFVKSIDKTDPENHPKTKQGERSNPGNPSAPCIWKIGTPVSEQLIKNKWWKNECPNNWPLDEHRRGQHCEKQDSIACRPRRSRPDFFKHQESDHKSNKRERHIRSHQRCQSHTQQIQTNRRQRGQRGPITKGSRTTKN